MRAIVMLSVTLAFATPCLAQRPHGPIGCNEVGDFANSFRDYALHVATDSGSAAVRSRAAWNIPRVTNPDQLFFVTDETICDRAAHAHAREAHTDTLNPNPVFLLRVDSACYIAFNGTEVGEYTVYFVFDMAFKFLSVIRMQ